MAPSLATSPSTQRDPIGLGGGLNQYGYAGGDPINNSDPFGLCPPKDIDVSTCDASTSLGSAWMALDGSGSRGRSVIAGIVANNIKVNMAGSASVSTVCKGSAHGCIGGDGSGLTLTLNVDDLAGALAVTIAHEFGHFILNHVRDEADVRGRARDEIAAIQYSRPVYTGLQGEDRRREARAVHGTDMNALATRESRDRHASTLCRRLANEAGVSDAKC